MFLLRSVQVQCPPVRRVPYRGLIPGQKAEELEQMISEAASSCRAIMKNSGASQGFDGIGNIKKAADDLRIYGGNRET